MKKYSKAMLKAVELQMAKYDHMVKLPSKLGMYEAYEYRGCSFCDAAPCGYGGCDRCIIAVGDDPCDMQSKWVDASRKVWSAHLYSDLASLRDAIRAKQQVLIDMIGKNGYDVVEVDA